MRSGTSRCLRASGLSMGPSSSRGLPCSLKPVSSTHCVNTYKTSKCGFTEVDRLRVLVDIDSEKVEQNKATALIDTYYKSTDLPAIQKDPSQSNRQVIPAKKIRKFLLGLPEKSSLILLPEYFYQQRHYQTCYQVQRPQKPIISILGTLKRHHQSRVPTYSEHIILLSPLTRGSGSVGGAGCNE